MTTHRKLARVCTSVIVPAQPHPPAAWEGCAELPPVLGDDVVRSCEDLAVIVATQGRVVARLLDSAKYHSFRLLARYDGAGTLAGWVEWFREPVSGTWVQWDEPMTACAYGEHGERQRRVRDATVHQLGAEMHPIAFAA